MNHTQSTSEEFFEFVEFLTITGKKRTVRNYCHSAVPVDWGV